MFPWRNISYVWFDLDMTTQPGWYPDPQNPSVMRYWDGHQWTGHMQASQAAMPPVPPAPPKKKRWLRNLILLGGVLIGLAIITNIGNSDSSPAPETATAAPVVPTPNEPDLRDASTYREVDERELALILKDPRPSEGERIIIYGKIWQFDTRTGPDRFFAQISTNANGAGNNDDAQLIGNAEDLKTFVDGDVVRMHVVVDGEFRYTSTAGKKMTVPQFQIGLIEMAG